MRLIYFGSGEFGLPTLTSLVEAGHDIAAVITQPDRPAGRKRLPTATPIAAWAERQGLPVFKKENVNEPPFVDQIAALEPQASVVIAFGQKLSPSLIDAMGRLAVNLHASLLPRYRGAAPINRAMIADEAMTGVSVIGLAQKMDAGPVYATRQTEIDPAETAGQLHDRLAELGPAAIAEVLEQLESGTLAPTTQDEASATSAPKFKKTDGTVDFALESRQVRARVHGLTPWPGCRVVWRSGHSGQEQTLTLKRVVDHADDPASRTGRPLPGVVLPDLRIACGSGSVELQELQLPGGKPLTFDQFQRGHRVRRGDTLSPLS